MLTLGLLFGAVTLLFMLSGAPIAFALGAVAVGALVIARLHVDQGRFRRLRIDELDVGRLRVTELEVDRRVEPGVAG